MKYSLNMFKFIVVIGVLLNTSLMTYARCHKSTCSTPPPPPVPVCTTICPAGPPGITGAPGNTGKTGTGETGDTGPPGEPGAPFISSFGTWYNHGSTEEVASTEEALGFVFEQISFGISQDVTGKIFILPNTGIYEVTLALQVFPTSEASSGTSYSFGIQRNGLTVAGGVVEGNSFYTPSTGLTTVQFSASAGDTVSVVFLGSIPAGQPSVEVGPTFSGSNANTAFISFLQIQ